jgi:flagellar hook-associated protein 2
MTSITSLGLGSGLDLESLISQLVSAEGTPEQLRISQSEANYQGELSALGSFRAALDTFKSSLDALSTIDKFAQRLASSSNEALFTVTATSAATPTAHDVEVVQLAHAHKLSSAAFVADENGIGTGTLTISVAGKTSTIAINEGANQLSDIRDAINNAEDNPGVQAVIVNGEDGAHLVLNATQTGAANTITVEATGGDGGLDAFIYDPAKEITNLSEVQAATDAEINIDGISVHDASNSISDAIDGVTINLVSASPGETARLSVSYDKEATTNAINSFVTAYNSLQQTLGGLTSYDATSKVAGPLLGDSMVLMFEDQLRQDMGNIVSGLSSDLNSLSDIGITTNYADGTLAIDEDTLSTALDQHFDDVGQLFASSDGFATRLQSLADTYLSSDGLIDVRTEGLQKSIDGLSDDQQALNDHLAAYEDRLRTQFTALDQLVSQLTATSNYLTTQLASLPGVYSTSSSG